MQLSQKLEEAGLGEITLAPETKDEFLTALKKLAVDKKVSPDDFTLAEDVPTKLKIF